MKRSFEYVKVSLRDLSGKVEIAVENRKSECLCTIQESDDIEQMFSLPLKSFNDINQLEEQLQDVTALQNLVFIV